MLNSFHPMDIVVQTMFWGEIVLIGTYMCVEWYNQSFCKKD